jgi:hypothetical protein
MAPIISMVQGVSKHFVRSCCAQTTALEEPNALSDISDGHHARQDFSIVEIDKPREIRAEVSALGMSTRA